MSAKHKWPNRLKSICRLPELIPRSRFERRTSILTIGSCFDRNAAA